MAAWTSVIVAAMTAPLSTTASVVSFSSVRGWSSVPKDPVAVGVRTSSNTGLAGVV